MAQSKETSGVMISQYKLGILHISIIFLMCGCTRVSTDPYPAFMQVRENVAQRTDHTISWNTSEDKTCELRYWLEDVLQQELTVDQTIQISLVNNPRLQAIYENLGIAQSQLVQAGLLKNPIFSLSLRYEDLVGSAHIIEMGLVQNFLDILLKPLKNRLACAELEVTKNDIAGHVMDVIADTKIAYYSLQAAEQTLMMKKQTLNATEAAFDVAKRLHRAGNITNLSLIIERSQYEQTKMDIASLEVEVLEAKERLNVLMGVWGQQIDWKISSRLTEIPEQKVDLNNVENCAIANSLDLQIARERIRATAFRLGIETSEIVFPEITAGLDSESEPEGKWFVGPQFSIGIPLFDFGQAKTAAGHAELSRQWKEYTALAVEVRSAARSAGFRLLNAYRRSRYSQEVLVPLVEQITSETLLQLNAMQLGVFDLLLAKQNEIETKIQEILAYRDYWIARTEIEMLLSGRMIHAIMNMRANNAM